MKIVCKTGSLKKTSSDTDLMTNINLCKAEGTEVVVCASYCWLYGLSEEFLNELTNKRPHLFYSLRRKKESALQFLNTCISYKCKKVRTSLHLNFLSEDSISLFSYYFLINSCSSMLFDERCFLKSKLHRFIS